VGRQRVARAVAAAAALAVAGVTWWLIGAGEAGGIAEPRAALAPPSPAAPVATPAAGSPETPPPARPVAAEARDETPLAEDVFLGRPSALPAEPVPADPPPEPPRAPTDPEPPPGDDPRDFDLPQR
jgi:hypothetical protein